MATKRVRDDRAPPTIMDPDRSEPEFASSGNRKRMFADEFMFEALPKTPSVPGWHFCWVSTTNQSDPPHRRVRMGYQPVRGEEFPEYKHLRSKSGEWEGCISINEMLLFKVPEEIYQAIMREFHNDSPNEQEERMKIFEGHKHVNSKGQVTAEIIDFNESGPTTMSIPVKQANSNFE